MAVAMQTENIPAGLAEVNKMIEEHSDLFSDTQCKICSAVLISTSQKLTHYQSKKHANKVRRYFSTHIQKEPELKKMKLSTVDSSDCNNGDTDRSKVCQVCNMKFSSPVVAESHYQGKVHAKNLRLKSVGPQTPLTVQTPAAVQPRKKPAEDPSGTAGGGGGGDDDDNDSNRFCSMCQASFNNPLMAQQHYVGKKHRKQMTKMKLMETYGPATAPASTLKGYPCTICKIELNSVEQYQSHISGAKHNNQVKKLSLNTTGSQNPAEQSQGGNDQYTKTEGQFASEGNQYTNTNNQYPAGGNQYTPEDTRYSEEYHFT
ncbi:hypothetical protein fugu_008607 [Takifugu bimaculatus]|uniref:Zinc finger protein 346 n=1 Tax=Takifugu bimaculatus TaxID=433685 RepID=A0A4Z2AXZ2_9TELE|nr:hypothetical protein fugu_008607 [Takifugu bimaculatus]